jgi:hypothetical protein
MRNAAQLFEVPSRARPSQHAGPPEILRTHRTGVDFEVEIDVVAVLAADRIFKSGRYADLEQALMGVYTYGQPAVGDKEFKLSCTKAGLAERVFRHVYARDWVPALPPVSTGMYHHFGNLYVSTPRGWLPSSEKPGRALTLLGSGVVAAGAFLGRRFRLSRWLMDRLGVTFSLEDHLPVYYVETSRISQLPPFP